MLLLGYRPRVRPYVQQRMDARLIMKGFTLSDDLTPAEENFWRRLVLTLSAVAVVLSGVAIYVIATLGQDASAHNPVIQVTSKGSSVAGTKVSVPAIEIDPASCLVLNTSYVIARKDGDICTVTIQKGENVFLMGFGGWCKALDTTTPAPEGSWVVRIKDLPDTPPAGFTRHFMFARLNAETMGAEEFGYDMSMVGLKEDTTSEVVYDDCMTQPESHI
jgi:hypothetical protein